LNEKLILTEDSNVKLKTKMSELVAETERLISSDTPGKSGLENLLKKIRDVETYQKDSEKSLADHETTRFESANSSVTSETDDVVGCPQLWMFNLSQTYAQICFSSPWD